MTPSDNSWETRIRIFAYILLGLKLIAAVCFSIAGPIHERMNRHIYHDWFSVEIGTAIYLVGAVAALLLIMKYRYLALLLLFITGSLLFTHYIYIHKVNIFSTLLAYWECAVLSFMLWRMHKARRLV